MEFHYPRSFALAWRNSSSDSCPFEWSSTSLSICPVRSDEADAERWGGRFAELPAAFSGSEQRPHNFHPASLLNLQRGQVTPRTSPGDSSFSSCIWQYGHSLSFGRIGLPHEGHPTSCAWQYGHFWALGWILLRQEGHTTFSPTANAAASPNGPKRRPMPDHKYPFAPRLVATALAPIPQKIQMTMMNMPMMGYGGFPSAKSKLTPHLRWCQ